MTHETASPENREGLREGFFQRCIDLIVSPDEGFTKIIARPEKVGPVVLIVLATLLSLPASIYQSQLMAEEFPQLPATALGPQRLAIVFISALVASLLWWPLRGGIFHWLGMLTGAPMTWPQSLAVSGYLYLVPLLQNLVSAIVIWTTGQNITLGLGMGLSFRELLTPRGVFLAQLNIFTLWYLVLSTIGLAKLWQSSKVKSGLMTVLLWAVVVGLSVWQASFSSRMLNQLG